MKLALAVVAVTGLGLGGFPSFASAADVFGNRYGHGGGHATRHGGHRPIAS